MSATQVSTAVAVVCMAAQTGVLAKNHGSSGLESVGHTGCPSEFKHCLSVISEKRPQTQCEGSP